MLTNPLLRMGSVLATTMLVSASTPFARVHASASAAVMPSETLLTVGQVVGAFPSSSVLPDNVRLLGSSRSATVVAAPCVGSPHGDLLQAGATTEVSKSFGSSHSLSAWTISALVFHNAAAAGAFSATFIARAKTCPTTRTESSGNSVLRIFKTLGARYDRSGWDGYRSIYHESVTTQTGAKSAGLRTNVQYLSRGNIVLIIQEDGLIATGTGKLQEQQLKSVTALILHRL